MPRSLLTGHSVLVNIILSPCSPSELEQLSLIVQSDPSLNGTDHQLVLCDEQTMPYIKLYVLYIVSTAVVISSTPEIKSETAMIID